MSRSIVSPESARKPFADQLENDVSTAHVENVDHSRSRDGGDLGSTSDQNGVREYGGPRSKKNGGTESSGHPSLIGEDLDRPELTLRAEGALENRVCELERKVKRNARLNARGQGLVYTDEPHIVAAWRTAMSTENLKERRVSWLCGVVSGCLFSFIVAVFGQGSPPPMPVSIGLLAAFSATLVLGWNSTR